MGQKVHPIGFRVGISRGWESVWFAEKREYTQFLHEDIKIRKFLKEKLKEAGISRIEIRRRVPATDVEIEIHASKPGVIYGRKSKGLEILNEDLKKFISGEPRLFIIQIRKADLQAQLVAESIAQQLEKRVSFRRAMKKSIQQTMRAGALGIKVSCSGRLGGADMSRCEWFREGRVPLHTLRADIDYGFCIAMTTYGVIGVKVWIYKGEIGESEEE